MRLTAEQIRTEAEIIHTLHTRIHTTFAAKGEARVTQTAWSEACQEFHAHQSVFEAMHRRQFLDQVIVADSDERETAVTFLEVDPWCFRSGYIKEKLCRALGRADLSSHHVGRVRGVILMVARSRPRTEIRSYCRLATKLANDALIEQLQTEASATGVAARQAGWILERIHAHPENRKYSG